MRPIVPTVICCAPTIRCRVVPTRGSAISATTTPRSCLLLWRNKKRLRPNGSPVFAPGRLGRDFSGDNWVVDQDFIPRYSTSASLVVEGVRPGESPAFTTMWTVLGYPPCSVVLPVWLGCNSGVPALLQAQDDTVRSPLCEWSNALKQEAFPVKRGSGSHYLHMARLFRSDGSGITQQLLGLEKEVYARSRTLLDEARRSGSWNDRRVERTLGDIEQQVSAFFQQMLNGENR